MLRTAATLLVSCSLIAAEAQIDIPSIIERKARERAERKVDQTIDKGFNKTEEGVDKGTKEATKKRDKKNKDGKDDTTLPASGEQGAGEGVANDAPAVGEKPSLKSYSKFDFIPGEQVVAVEDFAQDAIGDFPARWNTNTSGEVVTIDGQEGRWLKLTAQGILYPEFMGEVPDNATLEFDLMINPEYSFYCRCVDLRFVDASNKNLLRPENANEVRVDVHPQSAGGGIGSTRVETRDAGGTLIIANDREQKQLVHRGLAPKAHVAVWRQKNRLRVYLNDEKMWDLPRAFQPEIKYRLAFETGACENSTAYIGNVRVAQGAPDTRNKLITEGRLVTRGILFDSGSDRIKAESYGTLKEIGTVLTENATVKVRIIGHTDDDGDDAANLDLSKRRAEAVKNALNKEFAIDAARMETDGKGESQPAGGNDTPQGKANNRRVEFVKL